MKRSERCNVVMSETAGLTCLGWLLRPLPPKARGRLLASGASWCPPQRAMLLLDPALSPYAGSHSCRYGKGELAAWPLEVTLVILLCLETKTRQNFSCHGFTVLSLPSMSLVKSRPSLYTRRLLRPGDRSSWANRSRPEGKSDLSARTRRQLPRRSVLAVEAM